MLRPSYGKFTPRRQSIRSATALLRKAIDILGAFLLLGGDERSGSCANPHLALILGLAEDVEKHPVALFLSKVKTPRTRDQLIKGLLTTAYGLAVEDPDELNLHRAVMETAALGDACFGPALSQVVAVATKKMRRRVGQLARNLDPAADLESLAGERIPVKMIPIPSLFLPPPQDGRHGARLSLAGGRLVLTPLCFGYPLLNDPAQFGIDRLWLLGGGWHYAIEEYLDRRFKQVESQLEGMPELEAAFDDALGPAVRPWPYAVRAHLSVAFKFALARRFNLPEAVHREFARLSGLVLHDWFTDWLMRYPKAAVSLQEYLGTLPVALVAERQNWEQLAQHRTEQPATIGLALITREARGAVLVLPDEWQEKTVEAIAGTWSFAVSRIVRESEHLRSHAVPEGCVVAFGIPGRHSLVDEILDQRGLRFASQEAAEPVTVALHSMCNDARSWRLVVGVAREELAPKATLALALRLHHTYAFLDGSRIIHCDHPLAEHGKRSE